MADFIALTGFMGCGKSTVARLLAARYSDFFFDLDDTVELEEDRSISEIFASDGEAAFRKMEHDCLERIFSDFKDFDQKIILSLGGGTVTCKKSAELIKKNKCKCIYLRAGVDELVNNLLTVGIENRPLLSGKASQDTASTPSDTVCTPSPSELRQKVRELMEVRAPIYEETADVIVDIDGLSPEMISEKIGALLFVD